MSTDKFKLDEVTSSTRTFITADTARKNVQKSAELAMTKEISSVSDIVEKYSLEGKTETGEMLINNSATYSVFEKRGFAVIQRTDAESKEMWINIKW